MKTKGIIAGVVIVLIAGLGAGYWLGAKKPVKAPAKTNGGPINYNELLSELTRRVNENPNDWDLHARLGDVYFGTGKFNEAVVHYRKAVELNPGDIDSYNDLGLAYHYTGNTAEGLKYINDGIKKDPNYQRIWLTRGFLSYAIGNRDEAVASWQKTISINPDSQVARAANEYLAELKKAPHDK
ncbi:MAG: tetratricopeptide repeat protein [Deltaproteobacteria bacterium]|nr:tetratricopeptide repeat protein [Deltaproteobacteria bacterium]